MIYRGPSTHAKMTPHDLSMRFGDIPMSVGHMTTSAPPLIPQHWPTVRRHNLASLPCVHVAVSS
jgi:hypothetical protein